MPYFSQENDGVSLTVYVQPKASRNRICGVHGKALKVSITAPPVDGKANAEVVKFFAKLFSLPKASVIIKSGQQGRNKRLLLTGITHDEVERVVGPFL